jgi:hypothetical protein
MTTYGLLKISAIANNYEAWSDWKRIEARCVANGQAEIAQQYRPKDGATWRVVDKQIAKLREKMYKDLQAEQEAHS